MVRLNRQNKWSVACLATATLARDWEYRCLNDIIRRWLGNSASPSSYKVLSFETFNCLLCTQVNNQSQWLAQDRLNRLSVSTSFCKSDPKQLTPAIRSCAQTSVSVFDLLSLQRFVSVIWNKVLVDTARGNITHRGCQERTKYPSWHAQSVIAYRHSVCFDDELAQILER